MTDRNKAENIEDTEFDSVTGGAFSELKPRLSPEKIRAIRATGLRQGQDQTETGLRVERKRT